MPPLKSKAKSSSKKNKAPEKRKTAFWLTITVVASVWMFVLGILVGRGTAPVQFDVKAMEQELADLKAALAEKESAPEPEAMTPLVGDSQITHFSFYDVLKDAKEEKLPDSFDPPPESQATVGPLASASQEKTQAPQPAGAAAVAKTPAKQPSKTAPKQ